MSNETHKTRPTIEDVEELPRHSYDLIDMLDASLPHQCIGQSEDRDSAQRYAGARELIDGLVAIKEQEIEGDREESFANKD